MMEELAAELSTKIDAGLAVILIVFTGMIMFFIGLMTPFIIVHLAKLFHLDFGEFFNEDDETEE